MPKYDVIIVGGGPAGATAAYFLGLSGAKTLLIDKCRFPRDKACGGAISTRLVSRFPHVKAALSSIPVNSVYRAYLESPAGLSVEYVADNPLYLMIRRYEFDNLLLELARTKVEVVEGPLASRIEVEPDCAKVYVKGGDCFEGDLIVGADGANSVVARRSGLQKGNIKDQFAIDMMEETPYDSLCPRRRDTIYLYYGLQGHYGYGYVFPKVDHINCGVGFKLDYYLDRFRDGHYPRHLSFIKKLGEDRVISGESVPDHFKAFPVPVAGPLPATYGNRVLLCGDAGGFVNAFTAEGIYYAMISGQYAAKAAVEAISRRDFSASQLRTFEAGWKSEMGLDLAKSVAIQRTLLSDPTLIDRLVKAANRDRKLADLLVGYAIGSLDFPTFKRTVIRRALPLYLRERFSKLFSRTGQGNPIGFRGAGGHQA